MIWRKVLHYNQMQYGFCERSTCSTYTEESSMLIWSIQLLVVLTQSLLMMGMPWLKYSPKRRGKRQRVLLMKLCLVIVILIFCNYLFRLHPVFQFLKCFITWWFRLDNLRWKSTHKESKATKMTIIG